MGADKGLMKIHNRAIISYLLDELKPLGMEFFIVANNPSYQAFGWPVYKDIVPDKGPVGGIYTALSIAKDEVLVLSVDSPFVSIKTIQTIIEQKVKDRINVVFSDEKMYPLLAIYPFSVIEKLGFKLVKNELKLMQFIEETGFHKIVVTLDEAEKINLNSPSDVEQTKRLLNDTNKDLR